MRARVNLGQRRRDLWRVAGARDAVAAGFVTPDAPAATSRSGVVDLNSPYWTPAPSPDSGRNRAPDVARPW